MSVWKPFYSEENPTLAFAARELTDHMALLSIPEDRCQPVALRVDPELPGDSYRYAFSQEGGYVLGSNSRSVLLGVYAYLRDLGFVFALPGKEGTIVPTLSSPAQLYREEKGHTADFRHRGVCIEGADSLENVLDMIDWLPKIGFNAFFIQFGKPDVFFERWYRHENNPLLVPEEKTREELDAMEETVTRAMKLRGILDHRVGHGWIAEALGYANTGWREEEKPLAAELVPLTALLGGKRGLWANCPTNTNLCYSRPEARQLLNEQVVAYAKAHPETDYVHFWLADSFNNVCECEACAATTVSDQYVTMLNELDEMLTREGLDTRIVFLLYQELLYAPLKEKLKNSGRFCLMFAPISRTFEKSYPLDGERAAVKPYIRNRLQLPERVEENLAHYSSWKETYCGDSFFFDYPLGRAHYGDLGYMKIARVIYEDIHALKALDTNGYMSCQELRAANPPAFPNFVMGMALLDGSISYEQLKQTYFEAMFGSRWQVVTDYLEELSRLSDTDYFNNHGPRLRPDLADRFRQLEATVDRFLAENPRTDGQWGYLHFHGEYCRLLSRALERLCLGDREGAGEAFRRFCDYIRARETRHQPRLDVYRVIHVATNYTGFPRE